VIHEIDEALRTLIKREALKGTDVEVVFDAPTKDWSSRRNAPTADVYLYDIREDLRRRQVGRSEIRDDQTRVIARMQPPRWYKLSYLITAWTQRPEDEHRLLAAMLRCFLRFDAIPRDVLTGSLGSLPDSISVTCALPPPEDRALSDVWSALGGELKPSLDLVVTVPFDLTAEIEVGPPVLETPRIVVAGGFSMDRNGAGSAAGGRHAAGQAGAAGQTGAAGQAGAGGKGGVGGQGGAGGKGGADGGDDGADAEQGGARKGQGKKARAGSSGSSGADRGTGEGADRPAAASGDPDDEAGGEAAVAPVRVASEELTAGRADQPGRRFRITELPR
jgi:hypothetical protein